MPRLYMSPEGLAKFPPSGTSPTVDQGTSLAPLFTTDILGVTRPQGKAWDIGAYER